MGRETLNNAKRLNQIRKHLFDNRKSHTEEDFEDILRGFAQEIYDYAYSQGWNKRNELYRTCATLRRIRMREDYDDLYNKHIDAVGNVDGTKPIMLKQFEIIEETFRDWM